MTNSTACRLNDYHSALEDELMLIFLACPFVQSLATIRYILDDFPTSHRVGQLSQSYLRSYRSEHLDDRPSRDGLKPHRLTSYNKIIINNHHHCIQRVNIAEHNMTQQSSLMRAVSSIDMRAIQSSVYAYNSQCSDKIRALQSCDGGN